MKINKNITVLLVLLAALVAIGLVVPSGAAAVKYTKTGNISGVGGSKKVQTTVYRTKYGPIQGKLQMSHSFVAGVPSKVVVTYTYRNAVMRYRHKGKMRSTRWFRKFRRVRVVPTAYWKSESCHFPEGWTMDQYPIPGEHPCSYGAYDSAKYDNEHRWNHTLDVSNDFYDVSYQAILQKTFYLRRGKSKRFVMWVNMPRCLPVAFDEFWKGPKSGWPCQPVQMYLWADGSFRQGGWNAGASVFFRSNSLYVYPAPVAPTSVTGPTG